MTQPSHDDAAREMITQLCCACERNAQLAGRLAAEPGLDRELAERLRVRSGQYRQAVIDFGRLLDETPAAEPGPIAYDPHDNAESAWERAESETLTIFRDVFDGNLPPAVASVVKRHFQVALSGFERSRAGRARTEA